MRTDYGWDAPNALVPRNAQSSWQQGKEEQGAYRGGECQRRLLKCREHDPRGSRGERERRPTRAVRPPVPILAGEGATRTHFPCYSSRLLFHYAHRNARRMQVFALDRDRWHRVADKATTPRTRLFCLFYLCVCLGAFVCLASMGAHIHTAHHAYTVLWRERVDVRLVMVVLVRAGLPCFGSDPSCTGRTSWLVVVGRELSRT